LENKVPVTDKEFMEMFQTLPDDLLVYWKKNVKKSHGEEFGYTVGYIVGIMFVLETVVKPHIERMEKHLK
jgi:hypothetical protein